MSSNMRKSIARSENFLTGEVVELEKMKPTDMPLKGNMTIQLFDKDTGEEVQRVESENFISKVPLYFAKAFQKIMFLSTRISIGAESSTVDTNYNDSSLEGYTSGVNYIGTIFGPVHAPNTMSPFQYIALTDYAGAEQPLSEVTMRGRLIGYADKSGPYSGGSNLLGTVNVAETYGTYGQVHWVFDFPTNAANGIISSIYWVSDVTQTKMLFGDSEYMTIPYPENCSYMNKSTHIYPEALKKIGDKYYIPLGSIAPGKYLAIAEYSINLDAKTFTLNRIVHIDVPFNDFWVDGDYIWLYQGHTVYKYDWSGVAQNIASKGKYIEVQLLPGIKGNSYGNTSYTRGIVINGNDLYVSITKNSSPAVTHVARIDKNTLTVLDIIQHHDYGSGRIQKFGDGYVCGKLFVNSQFKVDENSHRRVNDYYDAFEPNMNSVRVHTFPSNTETFNLGRYKYGNIGARNLLPSPVEKTSQNTMKITYDFVFDVPPVEW